jgi:hypothetical protein
MKPHHALACLALAAVPAMAQSVYSSPRAYPDERLSRDEYRTCVEREEALRDRRERIDEQRAEVERDAADIARAGAELDAQLRTLDRRDANALADYNARSERHNRRVERQNRRVAEVNSRAALLNGDAADMNARCEGRVYTPYDREPSWRERGALR